MTNINRSNIILTIIAACVCFALGSITAGAQTLKVVHPANHGESEPQSSFDGSAVPVNGPTRTPNLPLPLQSKSENNGGSETKPVAALQTDSVQKRNFAVGTDFDGMRLPDGYSPSDNNLAVGPNHIVQTVNSLYTIYSKSGTPLLGPNPLTSLWGGLSGPCAADSGGAPTVQYDRTADRWIITQMASLSDIHAECIAVSKTGDPTGSYYLYSYSFESNLNDHPKLGVWPTAANSAYLAAYNLFANGSSFSGAEICAYDRAGMLAGAANPIGLCFTGVNGASYLPADLEGATPPLDGTPAYFADLYSTGGSLGMYAMYFNFASGTATLSPFSNIPVDSFSPASSVPQPGTSVLLDSLSDRLTYRLGFRMYGDHESMVVTHSVSVEGTAGVRWYELRAPVSTIGSFTVFQQGTLAPGDGIHRWMGSAAIDSAGDIALGYSASGSILYPSLRYTGRTPADPASTMALDASSVNGVGAPATYAGWSDYSSVHLDPGDDCTFWFVNQNSGPNTRIGTFKFSECVQPQVSAASFSMTDGAGVTGNSTAKAAATVASNSSPLSAANIGPTSVGVFRSGFYWLEDVDGNQQFNQPPDQAFAFGGVAGDIPITGDWNGDGRTKVGVYRPSNGLFILDTNGNQQFDAGDAVYNLGVGTQAGDVPVVGDWNGDGRTKVGLFRQGFFWILDTNGNGVFEQGVDATYAFGGVAGDVPVVGDWTGSGTSKIGLFRQGFYWILDANGNGSLDNINGSGGDLAFAYGGIAGDVPVVGDWNGSGTSKVGVFRQGFFWVLDANGNHTFDGTGLGLDLAFAFGGISGDKPVVGKWSPAIITATSGTPQSTAIHTAFAAPLVATLTNSVSPVAGVMVTFSAPASGASGTFASGATTATATTNASGIATSPTFTANATAGPYSVTASAPGGGTPAAFSLTNTAGAASLLTVVAGSGKSAEINSAFAVPLTVLVQDAFGNPVPGVTVRFTAPTTGASGSFDGSNFAVTNASGVATSDTFIANGIVGAYSVKATATGAFSTSFSLENTPISDTITVNDASVGQRLETIVTINLSKPAGPGGVTVVVTSSDVSKLLVAASLVSARTGSVTFLIPAGTATTAVVALGLLSSGTATLTASAANYISVPGTITMTPSGFLLAGPDGFGTPNFSIAKGGSTAVTVTVWRLDSSFHFIEVQPLGQGVSVSVPLTSSNTSVGTIATSPLNFTGGVTSLTAEFDAVDTGGTTLTAVVPSGFSKPSNNGNIVIANVIPTGLAPTNATVGKDLETTARVNLNGTAPSGGLIVNISSDNTSKVLLSLNATDAGSGSISMFIPQGLNHTQDFFVHGLGSSGSATYTASTGAGFGTAKGTVTLAPSGFVLEGPAGLGTDFTMSIAQLPATLTVYAAQLDAGLNFAAAQQVRGGVTVNVNVTSGNTPVGTITTSPVNIPSGALSATTQFQPASTGSSILSVGTPAGFNTAAQFRTLTATVSSPGISVTDAVTIGANLELPGSVVIGQIAPAGGQSVLLTSNNPSQLLFSYSATGAGSSSLLLTMPAGSNNAPFYLQAFGSPGTATYTATSTGFQSRTGTVSVTQSAVIISGPLGSFPFSTTISSPPTNLTVSMAQLDNSGSFVKTEQLAGGLSLSVSLNNSNSAVATISPTVTVTSGSDHADLAFTPKAVGQATISVVTPAGYSPAPSLPMNLGSVTGNVK